MSAFSRAVELGNTLLCRLSFLYVLFTLSMAFVVYMIFLVSTETWYNKNKFAMEKIREGA